MAAVTHIVSFQSDKGGIADYADKLTDGLDESSRVSVSPSLSPFAFIRQAVTLSRQVKPEDVVNIQMSYGLFGPHGVYILLYFPLLKLLLPASSVLVIALHEIWDEESYTLPPVTVLIKTYCLVIHTVLTFCADGIVFLSQNGKERFKCINLPLAQSQMRIIKHGVPEPERQISTAAARSELGLSTDSPVVATIGFINERKRTEQLLELANNFPMLTVIIAGGGRTQANRERVTDIRRAAPTNLVITGRLPENKFHAAFIAADLVVLPYTNINQSGILNWCAAYNVPVLASGLNYFTQINNQYAWPETARMDDIVDVAADLATDQTKLDSLAIGAEQYAGDHSYTSVATAYAEFHTSFLK
ncbi:glycosyltransferase family protein [Haloarcula laminariae]|uniref:hypothetical protein n=1 Tax=Haloarcula laminariae TaxID=2961577 RepID=UPI0024072984|nr:hypothetical protein [Halomicroarcula sp. FL173]